MEAANPEVERNQDAKEGDTAHEVAAKTLRRTGALIEGATASNGVIVTDEMIDAADMFVQEVGKISCSQIYVEDRVDNSFVHPDNWGTPDVWGLNNLGSNWYLHILDFKFGHKFVDAFENWQCLDYAGGVLSRPEFRNLDWAKGFITITIVQPRNFHPEGPVRKWTIPAIKLNTYLQIIRDMATEALGPNPRTIPGPECRDCRGRHQCVALHMTTGAIVDFVGNSNPVNLPASAVGIELRALHRAEALLTARISGLEEQAKASIKRGERVNFYSLEQGFGREKWKMDAATVIATGAALGINLGKPPEAITPAQARKAGISEDITAAMAGRDKGELKLIPQDAEKARKVFG